VPSIDEIFIHGGNPMLVLSRKPGEAIAVPQCDLSVEVVSVRGKTVRLGISAPPEIAVHREELIDAIRAEAVADSTPDRNLWDELADDLSETAYQIALRHEPAASWMTLELDVWRGLVAAIEKWRRRLPLAGPAPEVRTRQPKPARLPR
jgi:carbon storage regulator